MQDEVRIFREAALEFMSTIQVIDLDQAVYADGWNAGQIISHVIFYQQYYAQIVKAIVDHEPLPLIDESLAQVNVKSAQEYAPSSQKQLLASFDRAQRSFADDISRIAPNRKIPYKKAGRIYSAKRYLDAVTGHLLKHTKDLRKGLRAERGN